MNLPSHFETPLNGSILVVDDEPSVLAIAAAILNTIDITPIKARTGEEAIEVMKAETAAGRRLALVIQDLTMPGGISGFETLEALRDIDPTVRVIACSGFFQEGALELCRSIGFTTILPKPYTPDSLLGIIRRTLHESAPPLAPKKHPVETANSAPSFFVPVAAPAPTKAPHYPTFRQDEDEGDPSLTQNAGYQLQAAPVGNIGYSPN